MDEKITNINELLNREAALSAQLLGSGLTSIRKYDFSSKGIFYSGIFSISIGLERILKIILILDYQINNCNFPENDFLKKKGHKIFRLINDCKLINDSLPVESELNKSNHIFEDELIKTIVQYLTDFSMSSRYYNLDVITGNTRRTNEPLADWDNKICKIIINRHPLSKKKLEQYENLANSIRGISAVNHIHENGSKIRDIDAFCNSAAYIDVKQGYSVYYLYKIIVFFVRLLTELDFKLNTQLYLREHFIHLSMYDNTCSAIRRRKDWCRV